MYAELWRYKSVKQYIIVYNKTIIIISEWSGVTEIMEYGGFP
jgi:hypothetical protein